MTIKLQRLEFSGASGAKLAARLDVPDGPLRGYALFAHCFSCSKDLNAVRRISSGLAQRGFAVLRFDFTGLGSSEGDFASSNFSTNVGDILSAVGFLREHYEAPALLIGHSFGGAAVLAVAGQVPEARAVVTIAAPADARHVLKNFGSSLAEIEAKGEADVDLLGRKFPIRKQFLDDVGKQSITSATANMRKPLLILHSPLDEIVGIENASEIFLAAKHPKSFVSLDRADHLLTKPEDATYAAEVISGWVSHYIDMRKGTEDTEVANVRISETGEGKYQNLVQTGVHRMFADEPVSVGGLDTGPSPYDYLAIALGACTSMTLRIYAEFKKIPLGHISVDVSHDKIHAADCEVCTDEERASKRKIDLFRRVIHVEGELSDEIREKVLEIADRCPVHLTLESSSKVQTVVMPEK